MIRYFLLRTTVFLGCVIALWLVGLRSTIPLVLVAAVVSSIISLVAFRSQRDHAAAGLEQKVAQRNAKIEAHRTAEDD